MARAGMGWPKINSGFFRVSTGIVDFSFLLSPKLWEKRWGCLELEGAVGSHRVCGSLSMLVEVLKSLAARGLAGSVVFRAPNQRGKSLSWTVQWAG